MISKTTDKGTLSSAKNVTGSRLDGRAAEEEAGAEVLAVGCMVCEVWEVGVADDGRGDVRPLFECWKASKLGLAGKEG